MTRVQGEAAPRRDTVEYLTLQVYFYNPDKPWSLRAQAAGVDATFKLQVSVSTRRANAHIIDVQPPIKEHRKLQELQRVIIAGVREELRMGPDAKVTFAKEALDG